MSDLKGCRCGSGAHPRRCEVHPEAFDRHVAEINAASDDDAKTDHDIPFYCGKCKRVVPQSDIRVIDVGIFCVSCTQSWSGTS